MKSSVNQISFQEDKNVREVASILTFLLKKQKKNYFIMVLLLVMTQNL